MKSILKSSIITGCLFLMLQACVQKEDFDSAEETCITEELVPNITFVELKARFDDEIIQVQEDLIIEGYVISNDEAGNFFGTLHFQDLPQNPTQGFQINIDIRESHLFFETGSKIFIKLRGLYIDNRNDVLQAGGVFTNAGGSLSVGRLPSTQVNLHVFNACSLPQKIVPALTTLEELNDTMLNTLIQLENIQVAAESICQLFAVERESTDRFLQDCNKNSILLRNSGFSDFQNVMLPTGSGTITGVLGKFNDEYQLTIRNLSDIKFEAKRCDGIAFSCVPPNPNTSIGELKSVFSGELTPLANDMVIEATISANDASKNLTKAIYIQDETGGIRIPIDATKLHEKGYEIGKKIILNLNGLYLDNVDGEFHIGAIMDNQINAIDPDELFKHLYILTKSEVPISKETTINSLSANDLGSLITLSDAQFLDVDGKMFVENNSNSQAVLSDCDANKILLKTNRTAAFGDVVIPFENGDVTGILSASEEGFHLFIRDVNDVINMNSERCDIAITTVNESDQIFFSELADPNNNTGARFIELYNAGDIDVDLSGWELRRYTNDNTTVSSVIDLSGFEIAAGTPFVIASNATEFEAIFGFSPDLEGTSNGPAGSNGDDNLELIDANGKLIDIFGLIGEDGSGTNHEFEDGVAIRKIKISFGNPVYTFSEWIIYNDTGGAGTIKEPQDAPGIFTPGKR